MENFQEKGNGAATSPFYGVMTLDDKTVTSIRFERNEVEQDFNVSFHLGTQTVGRLKGIDSETLTQAVGDKNAKAIMSHDQVKGSLRGESLLNEYGITPEEKNRRTALTMEALQKDVEPIQYEPDAPVVEPVKIEDQVFEEKAIDLRDDLLYQQDYEQYEQWENEQFEQDTLDEINIVEQANDKEQEVIDSKEALSRADLLRQQDYEQWQNEQREPDAPDEINIVEQANDKELEVIDGKEALARANLFRLHDREEWAREQENLSIKAEGKRIDVENLSEKALEQDDANDIAERTSGISDRDSQQLTEREKNRQVELMGQVHNQFRVAGAKFYFKDQPGQLAMKDKGERMVTASNDDRVAKAMATMAEAKGWKTIKVSGHPEFKREVWMEANLRGIEARGYKPTEQDLKNLETKREQKMHNSVEHDASRKHKTVSARENSPIEAAAHTIGKATETTAKAAIRAYAGTVIDHGSANYNHDPKQKLNYFVKMQTDKGEETVWGVDLKRAMTEGKVKAGDDINLEYRGSTPVTVETLKRNDQGKVIGKEEITTNRNQWDVEKSDKSQVAEAVAAAFVQTNVKNPEQREAILTAISARLAEREKTNRVPTVPMYDKAGRTNSPQQERTGPQIERTPERTR